MKTVEERIQKLKERDSLFSAKRDQIEREIGRTLGIEISPLQFLRLRQLVSDFEKYEKAMENIQEDLAELRQVVTA